ELKLVPAGDKLEGRVGGPHVTPGYWKGPDLTPAAFDEDGFYKPGDAVRFADPAEPAKGIVFDGRLAEDFKLATGTWVAVGVLRVAALGVASPALQDAIIAGENREWVGMLAWLNAAGCRKLVGCEAALPELARHPAVREHVGRAIARWNAAHGGSSERIARVLLLPDAPSIDANEITDKGYINQRLAPARRGGDAGGLSTGGPGTRPTWSGCSRRRRTAMSSSSCHRVHSSGPFLDRRHGFAGPARQDNLPGLKQFRRQQAWLLDETGGVRCAPRRLRLLRFWRFWGSTSPSLTSIGRCSRRRR